jgi:hypothetical protein
MHRASARVELARVHPSWCVRALREESPAVQRLVTASVCSSLREKLQAGLLLDSQDLKSERTPSADVASWVLALWTERLVGGEPERAFDAPGIIVLTRVSLRAGYRLCRTLGICKLVLAGEEIQGDPKPRQQSRWGWLEESLAATANDLRAQALRDVQTSRSFPLPARHCAARIGLVTIARLLTDAEPFRLRWALQHWPYAIAKLIRSLMPPAGSRNAPLVHWETRILKTAWDRLNFEGRLRTPWPGLHEVAGSE